jgi:hypothetical protein
MVKKKDLKFGDDMVGALSNWGEKALIPDSIVGGKTLERRQANRAEFKQNDIKLSEAHAFSCSVLMNLFSRNAGKKMEHEIVSAVQELGINKRKDGKTPHADIGVL